MTDYLIPLAQQGFGIWFVLMIVCLVSACASSTLKDAKATRIKAIEAQSRGLVAYALAHEMITWLALACVVGGFVSYLFNLPVFDPKPIGSWIGVVGWGLVNAVLWAFLAWFVWMTGMALRSSLNFWKWQRDRKKASFQAQGTPES